MVSLKQDCRTKMPGRGAPKIKGGVRRLEEMIKHGYGARRQRLPRHRQGGHPDLQGKLQRRIDMVAE
jgi:hypothetical protein